jgi:hypothetical protein
VDGFRACFESEILLLDKRSDTLLAEFVGGLSKDISTRTSSLSPLQLLLFAGVAVAQTFGGMDRPQLDAKVDQRIKSSGIAPPQDFPIGRLLGDLNRGSSCELRCGIGVGRHRAILLKYLCDNVEALVAANCQCALLQGSLVGVDDEVVLLEDRTALVDRC